MKKEPEELEFDEFAARYCERQEQTPEGLREILTEQKERYAPLGWLLLECVMLDSSYAGTYTILPYGPNNSLREIPEHPVSPRGLASDMSVVAAVLPADKLEGTPEGDDLCDRCMRSGVDITHTDENGDTVCDDCLEEKP